MSGEDMEKIRLGFDEEFLERELSRAHASFDAFADRVRNRIDDSVFSDEALKRMYVANERLNLYMESMRRVEQLKASVAQTDEVAYRRYESQQSHMQAGIQRESAEYERARRGLPTQGYGQGGVTSGAGGPGLAQHVGMAVLAGGGQFAQGAFGFQVGGLLSSVGDLRKAYKGRYDPETEEHVTDPSEKAAAWGDITKKAVEITVGQAIKGYEIVKQQDHAYRLAAQAMGHGDGMDRFMHTSDSSLIGQFGMSRLQAIPLMTRLARASGDAGSWESVLGMEQGFGGGDAASGLLGAAARRGQVGANNPGGQEELLAKTVGAGVVQGLKGARLMEVMEGLTTEMKRGFGHLDVDTLLRTAIGIAKAGGEEFKGEAGMDVMKKFTGIGMEGGGAGRGLAMTVAMMGKGQGGLGLGVFDAMRASERGVFSTAEGQKSLAGFMRNMSPDMQAYILSTLGLKMHEADAVVKYLQSDQDQQNLAALGQDAIQDQRGDVMPYEELGNIDKKLDLPAITLGEGARDVATSRQRVGRQSGMARTERDHAGRVGDLARRGWSRASADMEAMMQEMQGRGVGGAGGMPGMDADSLVPAGRTGATSATLSNPDVRAAYQRMAAAYSQETGGELRLAGAISGDRTAEQRLSAWMRRRAGHPEESEAESRQHAAKDHSKHEDGQAIDVIPAALDWMKRNAQRFGFQHPARLGTNDPVHYEFQQPKVSNQTGHEVEVTVTVKPSRAAQTVAAEHAAQTHDRFKGGQRALRTPGPGTLFGGGANGR